MKKVSWIVLSVVALAGCQDRVIWDDHGTLEKATEDREVWDSNGQIDTGERKIWVDKDGKDIIK